ncbi:CD5 antigen, isoform CRA_b [Rattus norvegicus]|uniref:T-cell surface glycoprotein CD5 n=2 Tax=Rattus norvegicus TaxID=10116 RepID=A6I057_RAT|nr:T-cell surface glycoprotein CD5 precursor [Rattus norvegicus]EDM12836.1 CD5 antigen, isoform CRA_b [Rattus norvegicus]EDM12837.1 CD5 antigen, isoform CRA_b [Rattus norvegicus]
MDSHEVLLAATYLLGTLAAFCLGQSGRDGPGKKEHEKGRGFVGAQVMLSGSNSKCQGLVEVQMNGMKTVCSSSWRLSQDLWKNANEASTVCQQLGCGNPLALGHLTLWNRPKNQILCQGPPWSFSNCSTSSLGQCLPLSLVCLEPQKTTPLPTTTLPTTMPEPTAPPRLQLVPGHEGLRCTGVVEFYNGSRGGTILYKAKARPVDLGNLICKSLQCGSFLTHLSRIETAGTPAPAELRDPRPLPIRWEAQNGSCTSLQQCFQKTTVQEGSQALAVVCSDFQPKVQSRLVGGSSVCEGIAEVRQRSQWAALCDSSAARGPGRWEELCQEQQCGNLISFHVMDADRTSPGVLCTQEKLSQCYQLQKKTHCKRVFITCKDPNPVGLAPGTVASIILTLVLLVVLMVMCGPLIYKKLVKKFRQKKQRQWIGPTGVNQSMSFHRSHTATVRSQVENPAASHVDNEYSQPPRNSRLSAYPALEGALHRSSTQPDNSSDSDYDLQVAQRL